MVPSSCHRARGTTSLYMNTRCVLQEYSSKNDEVFKSTLFFPCGKIFVQLKTHTLFYKLSLFFPYIPSCEAHKQFGAEPAQYRLEINFNIGIPWNYTLDFLMLTLVFDCFLISPCRWSTEKKLSWNQDAIHSCSSNLSTRCRTIS